MTCLSMPIATCTPRWPSWTGPWSISWWGGWDKGLDRGVRGRETERVEDALIAKFPPLTYKLLREKPAPKLKPMTKGEKVKGVKRT